MDEQYFIEKACKLVADLEFDNQEACYAAESNMRILTSFVDETYKDVRHVLLMTDHVYDVQFYSKMVIVEVYDLCGSYKYDDEEEDE